MEFKTNSKKQDIILIIMKMCRLQREEIVFVLVPTQPDEKAGRRPAFEEGKLVLWKITRSFSQQETSPFTLKSDTKSTRNIIWHSAKRRVNHILSIFTAKCSPFTLMSDKKSTQIITLTSDMRSTFFAAMDSLFNLISDIKSTQSYLSESKDE